MAAEKQSLAQFEDFPPSNRRHFDAARQGQLGPGLAPLDEVKLPVAIARSRAAHDSAEPQEPQGASVDAAAAGEPMMSSYQAMQAGLTLEQKKWTGKRIITPPGSHPAPLGFGAATSAAGPKVEPPTTLLLGTTKQSPHMPGYCGYIPKSASAADPAPTRSLDKSLIIENYKPYGSGYTGRKG
ncbi:hypothetical protein Agub_g158 [Astrephomene gubernaculifera]|uniref:Uncharacterized protein n=1 Tax=Astrephomene gubernaculifera TaxID=47775 RepID=A0AAD3DE98_9CHLO|nr:hypothetical protein Agub_g158 [Astrephomene gubernaculifera]